MRNSFAAFLLVVVASCPTLVAQNASVQEPADLKVELRSATGSTRFQLGEVIPVVVLVSSSAPGRYLEPCEMFWEGCFGYPQCRFFTRWSLDVAPATGWTDIGRHGCVKMSGPTFEVQSSTLTAEPKTYPYMLTSRFRFDTPGKYIIRLSLEIGLDDETNQFPKTEFDAKALHHSVKKITELVVEILPAGDAWRKTVIDEGVAAWTAAPPKYSNPPSPELLKHQEAAAALCNLGTPEAAVVLAKLLSGGKDTTHCLKINPNKAAATGEMRRLLVEPDVGVGQNFFSEYVYLLDWKEDQSGLGTVLTSATIRQVRETLFAALPKKTPEATIVSLETVLRNPTSGYWVEAGSPYGLHQPYDTEVIALAAANFDRLSPEARKALLDREWEHIRSPLMLPVVRREAEAGNGPALLRWQELDSTAALAFMRTQALAPTPRFSATYLRLPGESLPVPDQQQLAANFVAQTDERALVDGATLLHRYATRAVLPAVLSFIDAHLAGWSCDLQIPVLAFLLKVSPEDARTRLDPLLKTARPSYCPQGTFLTDVGHLQAGSVLDSIAATQLEDGTPLAADAAIYLRRYGSAAMKPIVWQQFSRWHRKYVESNSAPPGTDTRTKTQETYRLFEIDMRLREAYVNAHGWLLSGDDIQKLGELLGEEAVKGLACSFNCFLQVDVGAAKTYTIYGRARDAVYQPDDRVDYLLSVEPYQYQVDQYGCATLGSLEEKIVQYPPGSKFRFAYTGSGQDVGDWPAISAFLRSRGYVAGN